ncbi:MAG: glycosyltransferase family 4 protein [Nitrospirota bacterium]
MTQLRPRVLLVLEALATPSSRLRGLSHVPALRDAGFDVDVIDVPRSPLARSARFAALPRYDAVVIQKKLLQRWDLWLVARKARRLVYDFDDAVTVGPFGAAEDPRRAARLAETLARCDAVIAGNDELARYAAGYPHVRVIPTGVDPAAYRVKAPGTADGGGAGVVIGWIGTRGNLKYLRMLAPAFETLAQRGVQVLLRVVSDGSPEPTAIPVEYVPWRLDREADDLVGFDIGVMPLDDTAWSRGKCGFKLLQYMAAGLPAVASPVGVNRSIIRHGENGLLADTPEEWAGALLGLIENPALRARLGHAARRTVEAQYSLARCSEAFVAVLREVCKITAPSAATVDSKEAVNV